MRGRSVIYGSIKGYRKRNLDFTGLGGGLAGKEKNIKRKEDLQRRNKAVIRIIL